MPVLDGLCQQVVEEKHLAPVQADVAERQAQILLNCSSELLEVLELGDGSIRAYQSRMHVAAQLPAGMAGAEVTQYTSMDRSIWAHQSRMRVAAQLPAGMAGAEG